MVVINWSNGEMNISQNLRGLNKEFGQTIVTELTIEGERLTVSFEKGTKDNRITGECVTEFADASVLRGWIWSKRNLRGVRACVDGVWMVIGIDKLT